MNYELPPGFRFHPTDEELIVFYLRKKAASLSCSVPIIPEVNIYKFDPWELPGKSELSEGEWYFFTPRDRKYPNGARPNRATVSGYWKATGTDKAIYSCSRCVGVKKALVFYQGRPPKGCKTEWIMHEYRLNDSQKTSKSKILDEWVLCRIYQKRQPKSKTEHDDSGRESPAPKKLIMELEDCEAKTITMPRSCSLARLLEYEYSQLFGDSTIGGSIDDLFTIGGAGSVSEEAATTRLFGNQILMDPIFMH
ncbi:hypothetical protein HPP92_012628 [Vanilla planifolia]|uniref:NAC domain-containing protein n=1 Tax=Vanilla planifolia TaxID=51239 RepID=A0A835UW00_VANPL|nr:hypothetical protein HPP92_013040 [Vanilla planifolia]KAG0477909.1 hypothetical protein HPP92_012628 [Vanilla planifolia]